MLFFFTASFRTQEIWAMLICSDIVFNAVSFLFIIHWYKFSLKPSAITFRSKHWTLTLTIIIIKNTFQISQTALFDIWKLFWKFSVSCESCIAVSDCVATLCGQGTQAVCHENVCTCAEDNYGMNISSYFFFLSNYNNAWQKSMRFLFIVHLCQKYCAFLTSLEHVLLIWIFTPSVPRL